MPVLQVVYDGKGAGRQLERNLKRDETACRNALRATAEQTAREFQSKGRQNISRAGNFGRRWVDGFQVKVKEDVGDKTQIVATHSVPYFSIFQKGGTISGRPLLWIPTSFGPAVNVNISNYPGRLFYSVSSHGTPLLREPVTGIPVFFGVASVRIPKKFRILEIGREVAARMASRYKANMAARA